MKDKVLHAVSPGPVGASKVNSAFHPSKVDQMSTRNLWELRDKK